MTVTRSMDVVRRAGRSALAGALERRLAALGVPEHETLLVAVSGGADSTALLLLATAVARRRGWRLEAATVDHHLRAASAADAAHAQRTSESLGVPCTILDVFPGKGPGAPARARRERYRALAEHARRRGIAAIATAHHAQDQFETMLLATLRGAGAAAAGGMRERRRIAPGIDLLRPLLDTPAESLPALLRKLGIEWRDDPTNDDVASPRVRIRREVIPVLEQLRPGASRRAASTAALLRAAGVRFERSALRRIERLALPGAAVGGRRTSGNANRLPAVSPREGPTPSAIVMPRMALAKRRRPHRLEMLRQAIIAVGARPSATTLERIAEAIADGAAHERRWRLRGGADIRLVADRIEVSARALSAADSARDRAIRRTSPGRP